MPADLDSLRAAVIADPDDDAARAVLGDALSERGDPRGELFAVQLALARANVRTAAELARSAIPTDDSRYVSLAALLRRQRELLPSDEPYDRGTPVGVTIAIVDDPVARLAATLAREPISRLELSGPALHRIPELARVPGIARITELAIDNAPAVDVDVIGVLLRALPNLTALTLTSMPFDSAILFDCAPLHALAAEALAPYHLDGLAVSPHAKTLARLRIASPIADSDPLDALDGRFPHLTAFAMAADHVTRLRVDPLRARYLPADLHLEIGSDPDARQIAAVVERASFAGVRRLALPYLPRGAADVIVATLSGKARDLADVDLHNSWLARAGCSALAQFPPLERLEVSHHGPVTDFVRAIAALRPKTLSLGDATDPHAIARAIAGDHVRDLTIRAPIAALASPAIVRLACETPPADLAALPNLAELVTSSSDRDLP